MWSPPTGGTGGGERTPTAPHGPTRRSWTAPERCGRVVPLARRLAARGFTVLVPDLPGNARSRAVVRRMPDVVRTADVLARWHRRLVPGPSLLVANSVGCQVAAALTYRHPSLSHRLVMLGPALTPGASAWRQAGRLLADAPREQLSLIGVAAADYLLTGPVRFAVSLRHSLCDAAVAFEGHLARIAVPTPRRARGR
ncbi:alpha/beta fold hydrolase [Streptomyces flaveolus]|uniref:alpha/beta hydrolase n=1 Tax=Streptomyces flaveolus TaxID=67297 RepID=UPI0034292C86